MKIIIGSDHAGYTRKERIKVFLRKNGVKFIDVGADSKVSVDYPDFALKVGKEVAKDKNNKGMLICGSGTGMAIAANKVKGVRASVCYDAYSARMSRRDNDSNVLCLRARGFSFDKTRRIINVWLKTPFLEIGKYQRRIDKIHKIEEA